MNKKLCGIGLSDASVLEISGFLFLSQNTISTPMSHFHRKLHTCCFLTRILAMVTITTTGHTGSLWSFPHDFGFWVLVGSKVL